MRRRPHLSRRGSSASADRARDRARPHREQAGLGPVRDADLGVDVLHVVGGGLAPRCRAPPRSRGSARPRAASRRTSTSREGQPRRPCPAPPSPGGPPQPQDGVDRVAFQPARLHLGTQMGSGVVPRSARRGGAALALRAVRVGRRRGSSRCGGQRDAARRRAGSRNRRRVRGAATATGAERCQSRRRRACARSGKGGAGPAPAPSRSARPRLSQMVFGDAEAAEIVDEPGAAHQDDVGVRQPGVPRSLAREVRDSAR